MINNNKVVVVLPAYNAAKTLESTFREIPTTIVDDVILVDDHSTDNTVELARRLNIRHIIQHNRNKGYGGNQKTCYDKAIEIGADIIVMLHPDYQYTPRLIASMCYMIAYDIYPVVLGSRILGTGALKGGMPCYKYFANRLLTFFQNLLMRQKLSEYHTGYRAYSRKVLDRIPYHVNSDDFIFDNQLIAQVFNAGFEIGEITCPTYYFKEASSINLRRSIIYGAGVVLVSLLYFLNKVSVYKHRIFKETTFLQKTDYGCMQREELDVPCQRVKNI